MTLRLPLPLEALAAENTTEFCHCRLEIVVNDQVVVFGVVRHIALCVTHPPLNNGFAVLPASL